jgi:hypothetical protein
MWVRVIRRLRNRFFGLQNFQAHESPLTCMDNSITESFSFTSRHPPIAPPPLQNLQRKNVQNREIEPE